MDNERVYLGIGGIVTTLIGGWDFTLQVLLILMAVDVVTGVLKALYWGKFTSKDFRQGILSKSGFIIILILAFQLDTLMGNVEPVVRTVTCIFYITIEGSSIIENLGQMGVQVPKFLIKRMERLKDLSDEGCEDAIEQEKNKATEA